MQANNATMLSPGPSRSAWSDFEILQPISRKIRANTTRVLVLLRQRLRCGQDQQRALQRGGQLGRNRRPPRSAASGTIRSACSGRWSSTVPEKERSLRDNTCHPPAGFTDQDLRTTIEPCAPADCFRSRCCWKPAGA